jgi:hypothetical protein
MRGERCRAVLWGVGVAGAYGVIAVVSVALGLTRWRPLYDGLPAQPYRWVSPPPERAPDNLPPAAGQGTLTLGESGAADPVSVSTGEAQATVIVQYVDPQGYTPDRPPRIHVSITPVDPRTVAPRPPGRFFDGNGYRIEATRASGEPLTTGQFAIVLRYAVHSTDILRWTGSAWVPLDHPTVDRSLLQIFAGSDSLGVFVASGRGDTPQEPRSGRGGSARDEPSGAGSLAVYLVGVGMLGALLGTGAALRVRRRKRNARADRMTQR